MNSNVLLACIPMSKPSLRQTSLVDLKNITQASIFNLFEAAFKLKQDVNLNKLKSISGTAALLFFEPSTRTRFSFESAAIRAGVYPLVLSGAKGTSLEKDETLEDTILNIEAMRPLFFVIRGPDSLNLKLMSEQLQTPVINAGWGTQGHPTQALLDVLTLFENHKKIENHKVLFVGDIKHSRVVSSHIELAKILKYEIGFCCPKNFLPLNIASLGVQYFENLQAGLNWADTLMALRVQKERHQEKDFDLNQYIKNYNLNFESIKNFNKSGTILHPGPINYGVELEENLLTDPRSAVLRQVENGTFLRQALIEQFIQESII